MLRLPDAALRDYFANRIDHRDAATVARLVAVEIRAAQAGLAHGFDTVLAGEVEDPLLRRERELTAELEAKAEELAAVREARAAASKT